MTKFKILKALRLLKQLGSDYFITRFGSKKTVYHKDGSVLATVVEKFFAYEKFVACKLGAGGHFCQGMYENKWVVWNGEKSWMMYYGREVELEDLKHGFYWHHAEESDIYYNGKKTPLKAVQEVNTYPGGLITFFKDELYALCQFNDEEQKNLLISENPIEVGTGIFHIRSSEYGEAFDVATFKGQVFKRACIDSKGWITRIYSGGKQIDVSKYGDIKNIEPITEKGFAEGIGIGRDEHVQHNMYLRMLSIIGS